MTQLPLEDQIEALVEMGKVREALALCSASGAAGADFTDGLRVALGVQLCDEVRCLVPSADLWVPYIETPAIQYILDRIMAHKKDVISHVSLIVSLHIEETCLNERDVSTGKSRHRASGDRLSLQDVPSSHPAVLPDPHLQPRGNLGHHGAQAHEHSHARAAGLCFASR